MSELNNDNIQTQNQMTVFNYEENNIRVFEINNEPWWLVVDLREPLGYSITTDTGRILEKVDELDKRKLTELESPNFNTSVLPLNTGGQSSNPYGAWIVNESGLYALIFGSQKEEAKKFKRWVTSEVLPNIRKHGSYFLTPNSNVDLKLLIDSINEIKQKQDAQLLMLESSRQEKEQLVQEVTALTEFKEDVENYTEFARMLEITSNEIADDDYPDGVSCVDYIRLNGIPLDTNAWCTLQRRTASYYRSTKGYNPEKRKSQFIYKNKDVAYIIATIRLIMRGL